jgi:hypothetical protein
MNTTYNKTELLQNAMEKFRNTTGLHISVEAEEYVDQTGHAADALVRLAAHGIDRQFVVEIKTTLTRATLGAAVLQLDKFPHKGLIVTEYATPQMAERLKEMDTPFIDTAGNAYINEPPVFIYLKGNRPAETLHKKVPLRAFQPTGLKVLFAILCHPELVDATYREIANVARVALGTVGWVLNDLREGGYLIEMGKRRRRLVNKKKLIDRWVTAYPEKLRPKLMLGRYKAAEFDWWRQVKLRTFRAYWGGEIAGAYLTHYLKPQLVTIYAREKTAQLLLENKLRKDPNGNVEVLRAFWEIEYYWRHPELVPPLLVYADLLATGDTRNIETARIIYDQELAGLIRED